MRKETRIEEPMAQVYKYFGIERPCALDMRRSIEEWLTSDRDLGGRMVTLIARELATLCQPLTEMRARIIDLVDATLAEQDLDLAPQERQELLEFVIMPILRFSFIQHWVPILIVLYV